MEENKMYLQEFVRDRPNAVCQIFLMLIFALWRIAYKCEMQFI